MGKRFGIRNERGFSLIEMLTVMMIMGILAAIAVPTFAGSKRNGQDALAQTSLRTALSAQRTYYVDYQAYSTERGHPATDRVATRLQHYGCRGEWRYGRSRGNPRQSGGRAGEHLASPATSSAS